MRLFYLSKITEGQLGYHDGMMGYKSQLISKTFTFKTSVSQSLSHDPDKIPKTSTMLELILKKKYMNKRQVSWCTSI